jgi:hypothetical protein
MFNTFFFDNRAVYEIMWEKNVVEPDRLEMTMWRISALHAGYLMLQAHTQNM